MGARVRTLMLHHHHLNLILNHFQPSYDYPCIGSRLRTAVLLHNGDLVRERKNRPHNPIFVQIPAGRSLAGGDVVGPAPPVPATGGGAGRGLLLSSVGLRAGIEAPPELAQAVLEGVFWCR